jgi:pimeloyl-ACP methyl ester carboxylesterase
MYSCQFNPRHLPPVAVHLLDAGAPRKTKSQGEELKRRRIVTIFAILLVLLSLVITGLGARRVLAAGAKKFERAWLILTGGLVNVGGHRLRVERLGKGSPVVVMEAGLVQPRNTWGHVPNDVAAFTQVVVYDRAGLGESDRGPVPRTSKQVVAELHTLLTNAGLKGPYILVGHSAGGLTARLYASQYPNEVVGMVLIDATHEDEYGRLAALLPQKNREEFLKHEGGGNYEQLDLLASAAEVRAAAALKPMPFVVLSAPGIPRVGTYGAQMHDELQATLARLVPNGSQILAEKSGHFIQLDRPELVTDAVRKVVEEARQKLVAR